MTIFSLKVTMFCFFFLFFYMRVHPYCHPVHKLHYWSRMVMVFCQTPTSLGSLAFFTFSWRSISSTYVWVLKFPLFAEYNTVIYDSSISCAYCEVHTLEIFVGCKLLFHFFFCVCVWCVSVCFSQSVLLGCFQFGIFGKHFCFVYLGEGRGITLYVISIW